MKITTAITGFLLIFSITFASPDVVDDIAVAIRSGNAKELAKFFNANINLNIPENEGFYSKAQAELILKDFFSKNPLKSFTILHQGSSKDGARYAIGNMVIEKGTFRAYFYMKKESGHYYIHEFSLSEEDEDK